VVKRLFHQNIELKVLRSSGFWAIVLVESVVKRLFYQNIERLFVKWYVFIAIGIG